MTRDDEVEFAKVLIETSELAYPLEAPMTTTPEQRAEWKALCDTATAAPWVHDEYGDVIGVYSDDATGSIVAQFYPFKFAPRNEAEARANTILTVSSRTALPALISHVEALEAEVERAKALLRSIHQVGYFRREIDTFMGRARQALGGQNDTD